jgi:hypothetical protein
MNATEPIFPNIYLLHKASQKIILFTSFFGFANVEGTTHEYEPIPITEEFLIKKFGYFKLYESDLQKNYRLPDDVLWAKLNRFLIFDKKDKKWFLVSYSETTFEVEFVHQLQNMYFCLCKKQLKIVK